MLKLAKCAVALAVPAAALAQTPQPLWNYTLGLSSAEAHAAAPDGAGGVYVAGDAGSGLYSPLHGAFIGRYSPAGALMWGRQLLGPTGGGRAGAVWASPEGAVFVAGSVTDNSGPPWDYEVFVVRLTNGGEELWETRFGSENSEWIGAACGDGAEGLYVVGETRGEFAGPLGGTSDGFVVRLSGDGALLWARQIGTDAADHCIGAVPDGEGGLYVTGNTAGSLGSPSNGYTDWWLARLDSTGEWRWVVQFGTPAGDYARDICVDGQGGVFVCGLTNGPMGPTPAGSWDGFVARLSGDGQLSWARQFGTPQRDEATSVSPDGRGGVYVAGKTRGAITLSLPNMGDDDNILAHFSGSGEQRWLTQFGTTARDWPRDTAPDGAGGVFVAGDSGFLGSMATLARFPGACYANCDGSTGEPLLTGEDFACFMARFSAGDPYANCDQSTAAPVLNIADFTCFLQKFATGCQ